MRYRYPDLVTYLHESGDTQVHIAQVVGTSQANVSRFVGGLAVPRAALAARLAKYAGIPPDSFRRTYLNRQYLLSRRPRKKRRRAA